MALILLMFLLFRRQQRGNEQQKFLARNGRIFQPYLHENPFAVDRFLPDVASSDHHDPVSTVERENSWGKQPFPVETEEEAMENAENAFSILGLNRRQNDVWNDTLYRTGTVVDLQNRDSDDRWARQSYQTKRQKTSYGDSTISGNYPLITTPSRAYLPFPSWRRFSETPTSPSIYPASLSATDDDEPDHWLSTPTSIAHPKIAVLPSQSYNWGSSAKKPRSRRVPVNPEAYIMTPFDSEDDRDSSIITQQKAPFEELRLSSPPPIPLKSPLRRAMSMRTMLDVSFLTPLNYSGKT